MGKLIAKGANYGAGIGGGSGKGTLKFGTGVIVYRGASATPTTSLAVDPQENVSTRKRYMPGVPCVSPCVSVTGVTFNQKNINLTVEGNRRP